MVGGPVGQFGQFGDVGYRHVDLARLGSGHRPVGAHFGLLGQRGELDDSSPVLVGLGELL
jgi:hypothetical protein